LADREVGAGLDRGVGRVRVVVGRVALAPAARADRGAVVEDGPVGHGGPDLDVDREHGRAADREGHAAGAGDDLEGGRALAARARGLEGRAGRQGVGGAEVAGVGRGAVFVVGLGVVEACTLFPYTAVFRSLADREVGAGLDRGVGRVRVVV